MMMMMMMMMLLLMMMMMMTMTPSVIIAVVVITYANVVWSWSRQFGGSDLWVRGRPRLDGAVYVMNFGLWPGLLLSASGQAFLSGLWPGARHLAIRVI